MVRESHKVLERARTLEDQVIAWRRDIHSCPELGFQEHRTSQLVAETLRAMGLGVETGVGKTGVVGHLGKAPPAIGIRADMDALPLQEANDVPYASKTPGVMHACGHDAHVAILLGVARVLSEMEDRLEGEIRFLFQPSEERVDDEGKSGAIRMVEDGALEGLSALIALHVTSDFQAGQFEVVDGYTAAAVDVYDATIMGQGCHDAYPHTGVDPVFILAQVINAIHGIRALRANPMRPTIISISTIHAGDARNVTPSEARISGTIRSYDAETREQLARELERALGVARALGGDFELTIRGQCPSTYNDPEIAQVVRQVVADMLGASQLRQPDPGMAGEDFGYMAGEVPAVWFQLGARIGAEERPHHSPTFDLDESVLTLGTAVLAETACRLLRREPR